MVGPVLRARSRDDHRVVRLHLTEDGAARLEALSALHLEELDRLALDLPSASAGLDPVYRAHGLAGPPDSGATTAVSVRVARVCDRGVAGTRVLVDRLWPRGHAKADSPFSEWLKEVAPSTGLRRWYGHRPDRFDEVSRRYREELIREPARSALESLRLAARSAPVVLVTPTRDLEHSGAAVLKEVLAGA